MRRALLTFTLTAALAGCGGDDKLSPADYRAELKKICESSDRKTNEVKEPTRATPDAIADYLTRLRDINARTIEDVEKLDPPDDLKDAHDRALAANREGREKVDSVIEELEGGGDPTQVLTEARKELEESSKDAKQAARDIGVPECAD
jgi:regulator of protease activity HflC (stomatin/prohibitin superfamily)